MKTQAAKILASLLLITGFSNVTLTAQLTVKSVGSVRHDANTQVTIVFSAPVEQTSATTFGNYTFSAGITVTGASLMTGLPPANSIDIVLNPAPNGRVFDNECVVLTVSGLAADAAASVTIQNVQDRATPPNTIAATNINFQDSGYAWAESGTPAIAGKVVAVGTNGFDIFSAGSAQWANYDEVVMVYKQVTGDFDLQARVEFQDFSSHWARAGVMARESLNERENSATQQGDASVDPPIVGTASRYADVHPNPVQDFNQTGPPAPIFEAGNNLWESHIRRSTGGQTGSDNATVNTPPYPNAWVRIQRTGGDIHTFHGADGINWDPAADRVDGTDWLDTDGVTPKSLNQTLYVGPAFSPETVNIQQPAGQNRMFLYQVRFSPITVPYLRLPVDANPCGVLLLVEDATGVSVNTSSVRLTFDGNSVTPNVSKSGTTTRIGYRAATPFPAGSSHSIGLTLTNTAGDPQSFQNSFIIPAYPTIPASYAIPTAATDPGLKAQVYQIYFLRGSALEIVPFDGNTIANAEQQWARGLVDPNTGQPYPNVANSAAQAGPINVDYINWNGAMDVGWPDNDQGLEIGDFRSTNSPPMDILDLPIPGIPGTASDPDPNNAGRAVDNIVAEIETYLHLAPGCYR